MFKQIVTGMLIIVFCRSGAGYASEAEWCLYIEKKDIKVYARPIPNSALKEYRAKTILDENIRIVSAVLDNVPGGVEWIPFCMIARELGEMPGGRRLVLNVSDFPWPFQEGCRYRH